MPDMVMARVANIPDIPSLNYARRNLPYIQALDAHRECREVNRQQTGAFRKIRSCRRTFIQPV